MVFRSDDRGSAERGSAVRRKIKIRIFIDICLFSFSCSMSFYRELQADIGLPEALFLLL